jgi:hypothetical protein
MVVEKAPLASATTEGYVVPLSNVMVMVSPARKPVPLNVTVPPAVGVWLLTEVAGAVVYGAALAGVANATIAMITPNIRISGA